jgi:hypothetical protein
LLTSLKKITNRLETQKSLLNDYAHRILGKTYLDVENKENIIVVFVEDNTSDWKPKSGGGKSMSVVCE